jgi:hypothetical protein
LALPIRIAVRVDFDDGSQHEYEVHTQDTAVPLPGFWPEGVVTTDVAARMEYDRKRDTLLAGARGRLAAASRIVRSLGPGEIHGPGNYIRLRTLLDGVPFEDRPVEREALARVEGVTMPGEPS